MFLDIVLGIVKVVPVAVVDPEGMTQRPQDSSEAITQRSQQLYDVGRAGKSFERPRRAKIASSSIAPSKVPSTLQKSQIMSVSLLSFALK
jgi:hypothetical protein